MILCILFVYSTAALSVHNEFQVSIEGNVGVYIKLVLFMSVYLALDDSVNCRLCELPPRRDSETGSDLKVGRFECGSGHGSV